MSELNSQFSALEQFSFSTVAANWGDSVSSRFTDIVSQAVYSSERAVRDSIHFFRKQNGQAIENISVAYSQIGSHDYTAFIISIQGQVNSL